MNKKNSQRAFTTVEVITVLLVGVMIVAAVIAAMKAFRANTSVQTINTDTVRQAGQYYALYLNPAGTAFISGQTATVDGPGTDKVKINTTSTQLTAESTSTLTGITKYTVSVAGTITPK